MKRETWLLSSLGARVFGLGVGLGLALGSMAGGCIAGDQRQGGTADTAVGDTGTADATSADTSTDADSDVVIGDECGEGRPCAQPAGVCREAVCVNGFCVEQQANKGAVCDDANPCTGPGSCTDTGECKEGHALENGITCDDDPLYCNGFGTCQDGECAVSVVGECPQLAMPCVDHWECSEALQGACAPVPSGDDETCGLGSDAGHCSAGTCVPPGMIWVPPGAFLMGCDPGALCQSDAKPKHDVMLTGYAVDRVEATEADWAACLAIGACTARDNEAEASVAASDPDMPLRWVDWPRAQALCAWEGKRLCTEAQWEKAARGPGGDLYFPWGNTPASCERAQFWDLGVGKGCGTGKPALVGGRESGASPYGVLDMAGNVAEWVADGYDPTIYTSQEPGTPENPFVDLDENDAQVRVVRGGGWADGVDGLRVFRREAQAANVYDDEVGTRCCWTPGSDVVPVGGGSGQ